MVQGQTYSEQLFESEVFRHFINTFLNKESGITKGCELEQTSNTITIGVGCFCIMGGFLRESTGTTLNLPTEAGYYKLVYEIDLSKINTVAEFNQGSYKFIKALGGFPSVTQEDLDDEGTVYQFEFCQFRITESGIADFKDLRTFISFNGIYEEVRRKIRTIEDGSAYALTDHVPQKVYEKVLTEDTASLLVDLETEDFEFEDNDILEVYFVGALRSENTNSQNSLLFLPNATDEYSLKRAHFAEVVGDRLVVTNRYNENQLDVPRIGRGMSGYRTICHSIIEMHNKVLISVLDYSSAARKYLKFWKNIHNNRKCARCNDISYKRSSRCSYDSRKCY